MNSTGMIAARFCLRVFLLLAFDHKNILIIQPVVFTTKVETSRGDDGRQMRTKWKWKLTFKRVNVIL